MIAIDDETQACDLMGKDGRIWYKISIEAVQYLCSTDFEKQVSCLLSKYFEDYKNIQQDNIDSILSVIRHSVFKINGTSYEVISSRDSDKGKPMVIIQKTHTNETTQVELSKFLQMIVTGVSQEEL